MDIQNRAKINIYGTEYRIATAESPAYVAEMGDAINDAVTLLMENSPNLSITKALVLCCLNTQDDLNKANINTDNLRNQVKEYLEDAARARGEADELRKENARLKKELGQMSKTTGYQKNL